MAVRQGGKIAPATPISAWPAVTRGRVPRSAMDKHPMAIITAPNDQRTFLAQFVDERARRSLRENLRDAAYGEQRADLGRVPPPPAIR